MKPIIYNIKAFDASYDKVIEFIWEGNQSFRNKCIVRNNMTNAIVYQNTQETLQLKHTIPAYSLTNGILYNITIQVIDANNNVSELANPILFYCYSTPTFYINNLVENQVVQNASYKVGLTYIQPQGEELQYYQLHLYNTNKNEIWSSGVKYDTSDLNISLYGLDDNGVYYIRATGQTLNGMDVDTGYIFFSVNYIMPSVYAIVTLENIKSEGSIKIQSNIISLEGKYHGDGNPTYINNDYINLTNSNNYVYFDDGFSLDKNFTINLVGYNFKDFTTILQLSNDTKTIKLNKKKGKFSSCGNIEKTYFDLQVPSAFNNYIVHSNLIDNPTSNDILSIWIRRKDNVYDLHVKKIT